MPASTMGLADPTARVLVHCHMGVNRAPSLAYAAMLELGRGVEEALEAIRAARPIAAIAYAADAVRWFGEHRSMDREAVQAASDRARAWLAFNPVATSWIISRIRQAKGPAFGRVLDVDWEDLLGQQVFRAGREHEARS